MRKYRYKKPYRVRKRKSIFKNRFFWLGIFIFIFFVALFYFLFISPFFQIEKIIISGNKKVLKEDIQTVVKKELEQKIFLFSKKNLFLVKPNKIKENILNYFPQIAKAEISRGFPDILKVNLIERVSAALWCQEERCFFLDEKGVIFEETQLREDVIKIINKQSINSLTLGKEVIEKDLLETIFKIQKKLAQDLKIVAKDFIFSVDSLALKTFEGWEIHFDPKGDIDWQLTKLSLVLKEKIPLENRKDLEYIELRFGNFATYKYRD